MRVRSSWIPARDDTIPVVTVGAEDSTPLKGNPDNDDFFPRLQLISRAKTQRSGYRSVWLNDCDVIARIDHLDLADADIRDPDTRAAVNYVKIGDD